MSSGVGTVVSVGIVVGAGVEVGSGVAVGGEVGVGGSVAVEVGGASATGVIGATSVEGATSVGAPIAWSRARPAAAGAPEGRGWQAVVRTRIASRKRAWTARFKRVGKVRICIIGVWPFAPKFGENATSGGIQVEKYCPMWKKAKLQLL